MAQIHVDDAAFVRSPVALVYRRLTDVTAWPEWWSGVRVSPREKPPAGADGEIDWFRLVMRHGLRRTSLVVGPHGWRHDAGFRLTVQGSWQGWMEWWLETLPRGTVVHHVALLEVPRRPAATLRRYRRCVRAGLWGFKDAVETDVRRVVELSR